MADYQNSFKCNTSLKFRLKGEKNITMFDVPPFKINNENDVF